MPVGAPMKGAMARTPGAERAAACKALCTWFAARTPPTKRYGSPALAQSSVNVPLPEVTANRPRPADAPFGAGGDLAIATAADRIIGACCQFGSRLRLARS